MQTHNLEQTAVWLDSRLCGNDNRNEDHSCCEVSRTQTIEEVFPRKDGEAIHRPGAGFATNHEVVPEQTFLSQGAESPQIPLAHNFLALALNRRHAVEDEIDLEARGER